MGTNIDTIDIMMPDTIGILRLSSNGKEESSDIVAAKAPARAISGCKPKANA